MALNLDHTLRNAVRQLETERDRIDRQIMSLRSALGSGGDSTRQRRGRRRPMSAAARKAASRRMKAYWAKRRSAQERKAKSA